MRTHRFTIIENAVPVYVFEGTLAECHQEAELAFGNFVNDPQYNVQWQRINEREVSLIRRTPQGGMTTYRLLIQPMSIGDKLRSLWR